jgi:hypothetical protein
MLLQMLQPLLLDIEPIRSRSWEFNPAISPWLLAPGALAAAVAVVYLYRAQQKIASRAIVNTLTVVRTLLVLLVFALLLGPVLQWSRARHSNGTLWVLADQSLSMRQTDPQSAPEERLRWADALGYLPSDLNPPRLDVQAARLAALRDDIEFLKAQGGPLLDDEKGQKERDQLSRSMSDWSAKLGQVIDAIDKDPAARGRTDVSNDLRQSLSLSAQAATQLQSTRPDETAAAIPAQALHDSLSAAISRLRPLADAAVSNFRNDHASDPRVQNALAKVKQLSRADLAFAALTGKSSRGLKSLADELGRQDVKVVRFGDSTQLVSPETREVNDAIKKALTPAGQNTDIASALRFVGEQIGEDSTVLVVSDGRQNVGANPEDPARFLASRGARVFTLSIGSHETARDAAVDHVDAPDWVYAEDDVVIAPLIRLDGLKDREVTVELRRGGQVIETRKIKAKTDQDKQRLRFADKPPKEGLYDYDVVIQPVADEAVADNNRQAARVAVKKDKLNVLLVEDEPRWEYQFLRNYLARDHRVKLQVVLIEPARIENVQAPGGIKASPNRGDNEVDAQVLPSTRQEWSAFDIVVLGDVPPEKLPPDQQKHLTAALRDGSVKGLLMIAGPRNLPMRYGASPLSEVMPVELSGSRWTPQELQDHLRRGFQPAEAPDGLNSILAQFSQDAGANAELWASVPLSYWHAEQTLARPGASVIWSIENPSTASRSQSQPAPGSPDEMEALRQHALLSTMNVGLGRVMYLASPETWRLRFVQTSGPDAHIEDLHRRFWGQVVRWAVGSDLPAGGKFVKFGTNKHSYIGGEPVVVTARALKDDFTPVQGQTFKVQARPSDARSGGPAIEATMVEAPAEGPGIYRATLSLPAGSFDLTLHGGEIERLLAADTTADAKQRSLQIDVQPNAMVEDRDVNADPQRMSAIAKAGAGIALDGPYFDVLATHLPVVSHTDVQVTQAGLFSNPNDPRTSYAHWAFFAIFVVLITAEWVLRKRGGLV